MNKKQLNKYHTRLGIKPLSPATINVKDADVDSAVPEEVKEKVLAYSEVEEAKVMEGANDHEHAAEGDIRVDAGDEEVAESTPILEGEVADKVEPRTALATATILPLGLLGTKKAWIWILVLVCMAIAVYFLWRSHSRKDEIASPLKEEVQTSSGDPVRDYLAKYNK